MKNRKEKIKNIGRNTAAFWLSASVQSKDKDIVAGHIEVLKEAAICILAPYAFNRAKPECWEEPVSEVHSIMSMKEEIEDEIAFIKTNEKTLQTKQMGEPKQ